MLPVKQTPEPILEQLYQAFKDSLDPAITINDFEGVAQNMRDIAVFLVSISDDQMAAHRKACCSPEMFERKKAIFDISEDEINRLTELDLEIFDIIAKARSKAKALFAESECFLNNDPEPSAEPDSTAQAFIPSGEVIGVQAGFHRA